MDRGAWWATVHRVTELDMTKATCARTCECTSGCWLAFPNGRPKWQSSLCYPFPSLYSKPYTMQIDILSTILESYTVPFHGADKAGQSEGERKGLG